MSNQYYQACTAEERGDAAEARQEQDNEGGAKTEEEKEKRDGYNSVIHCPIIGKHNDD